MLKPLKIGNKGFLMSRKEKSLNNKENCLKHLSGSNAIGRFCTQEIVGRRRENFLNEGYNKRRKLLEDITHENHKIYERIQRQKSYYSREIYKKAYDESLSISRRLTESKMSKRSSSSSSVRSSQIRNKTTSKAKTNNIYHFEQKEVTKLKLEDLKKYEMIFKPSKENKLKMRTCEIKTDHKRTRTLSTMLKGNSVKLKENDEKENRLVLPILWKCESKNMKKVNKNMKSFNYFKSEKNSSFRMNLDKTDDGDLLHIIAEEMFTNKKNKL